MMQLSRTALVPFLLALALCSCGDEDPGGGGTEPPAGAHLELLGVARNLGPQPNILAPSASAQAFFVGDFQSPLLTVLAAEDGRLLRTIPIDQASETLGIAASPDGRLVYIAAVGGSTVLVYSLETGLPEREPLLVGQAANLVATSNDGRLLLATAFGAGLLVVFDSVFNYERVGSSLVLDDQPAGLVVTRSTFPERAYVVGLRRGKIFEIEFTPSRVAITDSLLTEPGASFIALSPVDENRAFVAVSGDEPGTNDNVVLDVNLSGGFVQRRITVSEGPLGLDVSPDGRFVVVANSRSATVSLIEVDRGLVVDEVSVGLGPTDVLFTSSSRLYVTLQGEPGLAALDLVP